MNTRSRTARWISSAALAALALAAVAPAAQADRDHDRGRGWGWGRTRVVDRAPYYPQRTVIVRQSSNVGPVLAGLIGGFVLGTAVSHATAPVPSYYYVDPYDGDRYASLDRYEAQFYYMHHPRVIEVIDARSGDCVRTMEWNDGGWRDCRPDWRDRGDWRWRDRGDRDDRGDDD